MDEKKIKRQNRFSMILLIIIFLLIIALLYIGFYAYSLKIKLEETKNNMVSNIEQEEPNIVELSPKDEVGTELNKNDEIVKELIQKIDFPTYAIASIYKTGKFNLNTIPNDLILRLSWAKADKELIKNNIGEYKQTVTKEKFAESVMDIFGRKLDYSDESFTNIDVPTFHAYYANRGVINYNNNSYTASYRKGSGDAAFIQQEVEKVLKYSNKIEVYVKTAFVDSEYSSSTRSFNYVMYKKFNTDKFDEELGRITPTALKNNYSNQENYNSSFNSNSKILEVAEQLNLYVYTFTIDGNDGNYYLSEFNKAE